MEKREDTKRRISQRNYERRNKERRYISHKVWGTNIDRSLAEEIDTFLLANNITKVELIRAGYDSLKSKQ